MIGTRQGLGLAGTVVAAGIGIWGLSVSGNVPVRFDQFVFVQPKPEPAWIQRIALVDEAIGRAELSRAIYEWREAYSAALRTRRWQALAEVGDRAARIAELTRGSSQFRAEARQAYLDALLRARAEQSLEGVTRVADAFEKLGDIEMARQVRRIAESLS